MTTPIAAKTKTQTIPQAEATDGLVRLRLTGSIAAFGLRGSPGT